MGKVTVRYYVTRKSSDGPKSQLMGYWAPCLKRRSKKTGQIEPTLMAKLGFKLVDCGPDGPRAWATAELWNERWDQAYEKWKKGEIPIEPRKIDRVYPPNSVGEGFAKFRATKTWAKKAPRTREQWERAWKRIDPIFGDVDPNTVDLDLLDSWYATLLEVETVHEAYLAMKYWRALWRVIGTIKRADGEFYCSRNEDPSLGIRRETPKSREEFWHFDEARKLVKGAWRLGFHGLAAALAAAWDTMMSPVDVRSLSLSQLTLHAGGPLFRLGRAKTGRPAIGTLSHKTERIVARYVATLPFTLHPDMPIFHTRGGKPVSRPGTIGGKGGDRGGGRPVQPRPYTKDKLGSDFRVVRDAVFKGDTRTIADFRRSGALEAVAGEAAPTVLAGKMANSIDSNKRLQATYMPHQVAVVRLADEARERGRELLRQDNLTKGAGG